MPYCSFSLEHYADILKSLSRDHLFLLPRETSTEVLPERFVILRHDLDWSPIIALDMARLEAELGIRAGYYILLNSLYYNIFEDKFFNAIDEIKRLGHEIGLHYDPESYISKNLDVNTAISKEAKVLETAFDIRIRSISQHKPAMNGIAAVELPEYINCYHFNDETVTYMSDSCAHWRNGCVCQHIALPRVHVLVHPIHWIAPHLTWQARSLFITEQICGTLSKITQEEIRQKEQYLDIRSELDKQ